MKQPRKRVLVVDDNTDAAEALALILEGMGHAVAVAHEGQAALHLCRKLRSDVVLLDIFLPGMDGYEVASRLRAEFGRNVCILATTGFGGADVRQRALQAGFDYHMLKPLDTAFLQSLFG